jgi:hypothetical protein
MCGTLIQPSPKEALLLRNRNCCYCGSLFQDVGSTKEHVVSRNFVPKNTLIAQWNLILRACHRCNGEKSKLENDISAVTMQPDGFGNFVSNDARLKSEASRKTRSVSRRTGKSVGNSREKLNVSHQFAPGVTMNFEMIAPPQVDNERTFALAKFHIQGFFFFITFDKVSDRGGFIPGIFAPIMISRRSDWGNSLMRAFALATGSWCPRFIGTAADRYFRVSIRREPTGAEVWSWALEWNQNFRVIGFFGNVSAVDVERRKLPQLLMKDVIEGPIKYRVRLDVPLAPEDDRLFILSSDEAKAPA